MNNNTSFFLAAATVIAGVVLAFGQAASIETEPAPAAAHVTDTAPATVPALPAE